MAVDREAFARSMRAVRKLDAETEGLVSALQRLTDATRELFMVDGAGLMLLDDEGGLRWVSVTDDAGAALLEQAQQELGEGPCVDAVNRERAVASTDVTTDPAYPRLAKAMAGGSVRAVLGVPVRLRGPIAGTLNVFSTKVRDWDDEDIAAVDAYADVVGHLLDKAMEAQRAEQLEHALTARILVEQAKGILMEREGMQPAEAFERLRREARASRRKVAEVAKQVVDDAGPEDAPPAGAAAAAAAKEAVAAVAADPLEDASGPVTSMFGEASPQS